MKSSRTYATPNNDMEQARQLWERSLAFWETEEEGRKEERRACVLFHLGLWWRRYAVQHRGEYESACTKARDYYQQCIEILQQVNRLDLVAKFIIPLGETLFQLQQWDELQKVATQVIELNNIYPNNTRLAYAYGLLAEVALGRDNWDHAKACSQLALKIHEISLSSSSVKVNERDVNTKHDSHFLLTSKLYKSWYLFLISQALQHLKKIPSALQKLKMAQEEAIPDYHPQLYTRIL